MRRTVTVGSQRRSSLRITLTDGKVSHSVEVAVEHVRRRAARSAHRYREILIETLALLDAPRHDLADSKTALRDGCNGRDSDVGRDVVEVKYLLGLRLIE